MLKDAAGVTHPPPHPAPAPPSSLPKPPPRPIPAPTPVPTPSSPTPSPVVSPDGWEECTVSVSYAPTTVPPRHPHRSTTCDRWDRGFRVRTQMVRTPPTTPAPVTRRRSRGPSAAVTVPVLTLGLVPPETRTSHPGPTPSGPGPPTPGSSPPPRTHPSRDSRPPPRTYPTPTPRAPGDPRPPPRPRPTPPRSPRPTPVLRGDSPVRGPVQMFRAF